LATPWIDGRKVHAAALPLAEFTGAISNPRSATLAATALGARWPASAPLTNFPTRPGYPVPDAEDFLAFRRRRRMLNEDEIVTPSFW
jgi:hypothetical protein